MCSAKVSHTTPTTPNVTEKIERQHRTPEKCYKSNNSIRWTEIYLYQQIATWFESCQYGSDTNHSIAQMMYGTNIKLPGKFFDNYTIKIDHETFVPVAEVYGKAK
ncbi:hypothetical protein NPIL_5121 [Nephila pilipes]|uniref:Uncharacterized protein n=1 Tax=Nephila pilipes TaxID=299642 RepID=A0A8X6TZX4_NEPPI|nr:hypothetical protein NPIL_5121 [Nephila pilipes]